MTGYPARSAVRGGAAMVASSHPAVSAAGVAELACGGNAVDATLAMAAMCWLALPGQCGIGGDAFAIVREPDGNVWTVGASGFGPDGGIPGFYRDRGLSSLPLSGALAVAAPGAMAAIDALHVRSATKPLPDLWSFARVAARVGMPCTAKTRTDIAEHAAALARDDGARIAFLPDGRIPDVGQRLKYAELAQSIATLAQQPSAMYEGEFAERAVAALSAAGAPFSGDEWVTSGAPLVGPAISHGFGSLTVHETPPPSPGWMVLQQLALVDGQIGGSPLLSPESVALFAAAARRAFRDRWQRCGSDNDAWRDLLAPHQIDGARRELTGMSAVANGIRAAGDTTSTVVVDRDGRAVSFIQSLAFTFGAHITIPGTGILLNNRLGRGAYLVDDHPNQVQPRRRPLHTLNAWLATDSLDRLAHVGNTPGGDGQVQWNTQLLSHLINHELDPQQAVAAPRFTVSPGSDANTMSAPAELVMESRFPEATLDALTAKGETVRVVGPWAAGGSALAISLDHRQGCLVGGADPRQDGVVVGV